MGSFGIGTAAATTASLIFTVLLATGDAALGKFLLRHVIRRGWNEGVCVQPNFYREALPQTLLLHFSQDGVRETHRLRLSRHHLLQREESVVVRVPGMVQGGGGMSGRRVLVRRESVGADAGYSLPTAERNGRLESGRPAPKSRQYVLHDEIADKIRWVNNAGDFFYSNVRLDTHQFC